MPLFGPSDEAVYEVARQLGRVADQFQRLVDLLIHETRPRRPGPIDLKVTSEGESNVLNYSILLPPPSASDVVTRRLTVNGSDQNIDPNLSEFGGFSGNDGDSVFVRIVDIDDATPTPNESPPREMTFTLTDTIAPPQPGELGLRVDSES